MNEINIAIVTSHTTGYASLLLERIQSTKASTTVCIINQPKKRSKLKTLKKIRQIGILGTLCGLILRNSYKNQFKSLGDICKTKSIKIIRCKNFCLNEKDRKYLHQIDLGISMGNGYIPKRFYTIFKYGMVNIHHELLPEYPGAQSIIWPIYFNRRNTGYSIHKINAKIDKGDILVREEYPILFKKSLFETIHYNYRNSLLKSIDGIVDLLNSFDIIFNSPTKNRSNVAFTTPTLGQFLRILINHYKICATENFSSK